MYIRLYIRAAMLFVFRCHGYGSRRHLVSGVARCRCRCDVTFPNQAALSTEL
jgi:hypothetical protein